MCPGDDVTITGIIKAQDEGRNRRDSHSHLHKFYMQACSVVSVKSIKMDEMDPEFSATDIEMIHSLRNEMNLLPLFVNSLCPDILGHYMVKF